MREPKGGPAIGIDLVDSNGQAIPLLLLQPPIYEAECAVRAGASYRLIATGEKKKILESSLVAPAPGGKDTWLVALAPVEDSVSSSFWRLVAENGKLTPVRQPAAERTTPYVVPSAVEGSVDERISALTFTFEGGSGSLAQYIGVVYGNYNGEGVNVGPFSIKTGELRQVLFDTEKLHKGFMAESFGAHYKEVQERLDLKDADQRVAWADSISVGKDRRGLMEPWGSSFRSVASSQYFRRVAEEYLKRRYLEPSKKFCREHHILSERGLALVFDVWYLFGGIRKADISLSAGGEISEIDITDIPEPDRLERLAKLISIRRRVSDPVRLRLLTIATGSGWVNRTRYDLEKQFNLSLRQWEEEGKATKNPLQDARVPKPAAAPTRSSGGVVVDSGTASPTQRSIIGHSTVINSSVAQVVINNYHLDASLGSNAKATKVLMDLVGEYKVGNHTAFMNAGPRSGTQRALTGIVKITADETGTLYIEGEMDCEVDRKQGFVTKLSVSIPLTELAIESADADGVEFNIPLKFSGSELIDGSVDKTSNANQGRGVFWIKGDNVIRRPSGTLSIEPISRDMAYGDFLFLRARRSN